jgi:hypothetical protein
LGSRRADTASHIDEWAIASRANGDGKKRLQRADAAFVGQIRILSSLSFSRIVPHGVRNKPLENLRRRCQHFRIDAD